MTDTELDELERICRALGPRPVHPESDPGVMLGLIAEVRRLRARERVGERLVRSLYARGLVAAEEMTAAREAMGIDVLVPVFGGDIDNPILVPHVRRLRAAERLAEAFITFRDGRMPSSLEEYCKRAEPVHEAEAAYREAKGQR